MVDGNGRLEWITRAIGSNNDPPGVRSKAETNIDDICDQDSNDELKRAGDTAVTRRTWLTTMSACVVAPAAASQAVRADSDDGYGLGEYGAGEYGAPSDDDETAEEELSITTVSATYDDESATLVGEVTELVGYDEVNVFFEWGESGHDLPNTTDDQTLETTGEFAHEVTDLESDFECEFRAVAEAGDDADRGDTLSFTTENDEEAPDAVPDIESISAEDTSNPRNPHVDATIEWQASIEDGELDAAELTVSDPDGDVLSWKYDLDGQTAERSEEERIHHGAGRHGDSVTYTVDLTVYSNHDTNETTLTTFESQ